MSETESVNEKFATFISEFKELQTYLETLTKGHSLDSLSDQISLVDYSKLNAALAYLLNSLYYSEYLAKDLSS